MIDVELLEQSPVAGIVIVALATCLILAVVEVIKLFRSTSKTKTVHDVALEVLAGLWGNGEDRKRRLTAAGYDPAEVQAAVNELLERRDE